MTDAAIAHTQLERDRLAFDLDSSSSIRNRDLPSAYKGDAP
jgi:hypothetical protein